MATHPSSPELVAPANGSADPELLSLPRPPRRERSISLMLMTVTAFLALMMTVALAGDVRFAFASPVPDDVGDMLHFVPDASMRNHFVRGTGMLSAASAIRYDRPLEHDSFRLAPLAGNDNIWVEMRIPGAVRSSGHVRGSALAHAQRGLSLPRTRPLRPRGHRHGRTGQCLGARGRGNTNLLSLDGGPGRALRDFRGLQPGHHRAHRAAGSKVGY